MITFPDHIQETLDELRDQGFATVVFTPRELQGVDNEVVEEAMVIAGWETIGSCKEPTIPDYNWVDEIEIYPPPTGE